MKTTPFEVKDMGKIKTEFHLSVGEDEWNYSKTENWEDIYDDEYEVGKQVEDFKRFLIAQGYSVGTVSSVQYVDWIPMVRKDRPSSKFQVLITLKDPDAEVEVVRYDEVTKKFGKYSEDEVVAWAYMISPYDFYDLDC